MKREETYCDGDAMTEQTAQTELVDQVIEQIKLDLAAGDVTAITELLMKVATKNLKAYLPETVYESTNKDLI